METQVVPMDCLLSSTTWIGGISTITNLMFIILFIIRPPASINFRGYQILSTFVNFFFALTQFIAAPLFFGDGTNYLHISCRIGFEYSIVIFLIAQNSLFMMLSIIFCFRYAIVCNVYLRKMIENPFHLTILWILHLLELFLSLIPAIFLFQPEEKLREALHNKYADYFRKNFRSDYFLGASYDFPIFNSTPFTSFFFFGFVAFGLLNISICMFCGLEMSRFISINAHSAKLRRINKRILIVMGLQALASTLFVYFPGVIITFCMIIRVDVSSISNILSSSLAGGTFFSPIIAFMMAKEYRTRYVYYCHCSHLLKRTRQNLPISSQSQLQQELFRCG